MTRLYEKCIHTRKTSPIRLCIVYIASDIYIIYIYCPTDYNVSRYHGEPFEGALKLPVHQSTIVLRGLREAFNWALTMHGYMIHRYVMHRYAPEECYNYHVYNFVEMQEK